MKARCLQRNIGCRTDLAQCDAPAVQAVVVAASLPDLQRGSSRHHHTSELKPESMVVAGEGNCGQELASLRRHRPSTPRDGRAQLENTRSEAERWVA